MPDQRLIVVFVHGWSVTSTSTYGALPQRLRRQAADRLDIKHIWLGKYVSFQDEVQLRDITRAFEAALQRALGAEIAAGRRFACITHSTGGPVVRDWLDRYYVQPKRLDACPLSHLIMLAPANFGSALAQLGKSRLSRLKTLLQGVEPGEGVLNWLELGSPESWELNRRWLENADPARTRRPVFHFVLTGQSIDHKLYDHVNSYTGEVGSDGVVRAAAANLNANYLRLEQVEPTLKDGAISRRRPDLLAGGFHKTAELDRQTTAFLIVPGVSHSGARMGILRSVKDDDQPHPTVTAVLRCLQVTSLVEYNEVAREFAEQTEQTVTNEQVEKDARTFLPDLRIIHDPHTMVIVRVQDDTGQVVPAFDLKLTGDRHDPNRLPQGFLADRQCNRRHRSTLTFFLNHGLLAGGSALVDPFDRKGEKVLRPETPGIGELGFVIEPHNTDGLVHNLSCELVASAEVYASLLRPHQATLLDIVLRRVVRERVFDLTVAPKQESDDSFKSGNDGGAVTVEP